MKTNLIDHISIVVKDLDKAREIYENILGLELDSVLTVPNEKIKIARYYLGETALELMEPTAEGEVSKFLETKGEGVFLISFRVPDVVEAITELKNRGYKLIDEKPRSIVGIRYAFLLHPKETNGVLLELADRGI